MGFTLHPCQLYFLILAGWVNRQQQFVIKYLRTENPAVCHDILEYSARVLDGALSRHSVTKFPFASIRKRNARSSWHVLDNTKSTQI